MATPIALWPFGNAWGVIASTLCLGGKIKQTKRIRSQDKVNIYGSPELGHARSRARGEREHCITGDSTGPQGTQLQDPVQRQWDLEEQRLLLTPKLGGSKLHHPVAIERGQHGRI